MELPKHGLVTFTWGNVSEIDRETGLFAIKPSGVPYEELKPEDMVLMDLEGNKIEGKYNPSSDTATHIELYKAFEEIWRHCTYAFVLCNELGTGRKRYSMLWNDSCRLYIWRSAMFTLSYRAGDRRCL